MTFWALLVLASQAEIVEAVDRFILPFQQGKIEAAMGAWSDTAPQRKAFLASAEEAAAYASDPPRSGWKLEVISLKEDVARLFLAFNGRWTKADEDFPDEAFQIWSLELRREKGVWKWWAREPAALELARELLASPEAAARRELLKKKDGLIGMRLIKTMTEEGVELTITGRPDDGFRRLELAVEAADLSGKPLLRAMACTSWGQMKAVLGRPGEAVERLETARDLWDGLEGGEVGAAWTRVSLGFAYADAGRADRSLEELRRAAAVAEKDNVDDLRFEAAAYTLFALQRTGRAEEAARQGERLLTLALALKTPSAEARARDQVALSCYERGDFGGALDHVKAGLARLREEDDPMIRGRLLGTEGLVYLAANELEKAARRLEDTLALWEKLRLSRLAAIARLNLGEAQRRLGRPKEAEASLVAAAEALRALGELPMAALARSNLGITVRLQGRFDEAEAHYRAGLELARDPSAARARFYLRSNQSELALARGDTDRALLLLAEVARDADASGSPERRYMAHVGIGRTRAARGDFAKAVDAYQRALPFLEDIRRGFRDPALRQGLLADHAPAYVLLADALRRLDRAADAFEAAEKAKARTLIELLEGTPARFLSPDERGAEAARQDASSAAMTAVESARTADEREAAETRLARAREDLDEYRRELYARHPELPAVRGHFAPATLEELQRALGPRRAFLSYLVGPERILLFALKPGAPLLCVEVKRDGLRERVEAFWAACSNASSDPGPGAAALYAALLKPVEAALEGVDHVVISPDGFLHGMPFQALRGPDGKAWIERVSLSYAPSATAFLRTSARKPAAEGPWLIVGDPEMPGGFTPLEAARREAETLAERAGVKALTGAAASETRVRESLGRARRIHLATHGRVDEAVPLSSFVVLASGGGHDGYLQARELAELELKAELLVLSACETARGREVSGEGVLGLSWSAFVAGVPTLVMSQWAVADDSTAALMRAFYDALDASGPAPALRAAQRALLKDPKTSHPYYWAPFVLSGRP
ncbi:MAG TPA: CHAT domain-containing protein [Planctomycetota bacterium]